MGVSKVVLGNETLIDLTNDSVSPENLLQGATAHGANGEPVEGGVVVTDNYESLNNKPSINGVELSGNKTTADLGIKASDVGADASGSAAQALKESKEYTDNAKAALVSQIKDNARKNELKNNAVNKTEAGMEFVVNEDKSITINGTNTSTIYYPINDDMSYIPNGIYIPTFDSSIKGKAIWCAFVKTDGTIYCGVGDNTTIEVTDSVKILRVYIHINSNTTIENGTFYPMLRLQSISDSTYEPYYKTNRELTEEFSEISEDLAKYDEYGNLNVPGWVKALGVETSDGIHDSGGIEEDNYYGGSAVVKTKDELSALTAEGYMPDALLVKAFHQNLGGYSFYNNPYVVYEKSSSEPFLLNGEYILSDSDTGSIYITDTENYYSAIVSGDYKRREGADTVSPFSGLGNIECVAELFSGDKYTTSKNCLIFIHGANTTESGLPTTIKPIVSSGTLTELAKTTAKKWDGHYHAIAVYYLSLNGESSIISLASGSTPKALIFV